MSEDKIDESLLGYALRIAYEHTVNPSLREELAALYAIIWPRRKPLNSRMSCLQSHLDDPDLTHT